MKAAIYQGTEHEISWSINDPVTPDLVKRIEIAGNELEVNWLNSTFTEATQLLLEKWNKNEIIEMIYDEDPDIIDLIALSITDPLQTEKETIEKARTIARLYLPVVLIILKYL